MDAEATEGVGATADFTVVLMPEATETVTVQYATASGTATQGTDFTQTDGTLTFNVGDSMKTISVPITDDTVADDGRRSR